MSHDNEEREFAEKLAQLMDLSGTKGKVTVEVVIGSNESDQFDIADTEDWTLEQLQAKLQELQDKLDNLEGFEPDEDEDSEDTYCEWEDKCSDLQDAINDLEDRIAEMQASQDKRQGNN